MENTTFEESDQENIGLSIEIDNESVEPLDPLSVPIVEAIDLGVVFEDLADQLDIVGQSIAAPAVDLRSKESKQLDQDYHRPVLHLSPMEGEDQDQRWLLKQHYETALPRKLLYTADRFRELLRRRLSSLLLERGVSVKTGSGKLQADRAFLQATITTVMIEIIQKSCFSSLVDIIEKEKTKNQEMAVRLNKGVNDRENIKQMKEGVKRVKKEKILESKKMERTMWDLEDATQQLMLRTKLESNYVNAQGSMITKRSKKYCRYREKQYQEALEDAKTAYKCELTAHLSMKEIIMKKFQEMEDLLDYWMEKYEVDKESVQNQLDKLKSDRARDLEKIRWLKFIIGNYSQVVNDNRRIQALAEAARKQRQLENKKATRIQAWWRGTMVRNQLGRFRPVKPPKAKKGGKKDKKDAKKKK